MKSIIQHPIIETHQTETFNYIPFRSQQKSC